MITENEDPAIVAGKEAEAAHAAWVDLYERQHAIENRIIGTDATSVRGLAAKLRLMTYFQYSMPGLEERHATPAKDIDLKAMIEEWREDGLDSNDILLVGALLDAERLAGA